jgi:hypothetical protein
MDLLSDLNIFVTKNFTVSILASLIIFNVLTILIQGVLTPLFLSYADPEDNFDKLNFTLSGKQVIKLGTFIKELFVGIIILLIASQLDKIAK